MNPKSWGFFSGLQSISFVPRSLQVSVNLYVPGKKFKGLLVLYLNYAAHSGTHEGDTGLQRFTIWLRCRLIDVTLFLRPDIPLSWVCDAMGLVHSPLLITHKLLRVEQEHCVLSRVPLAVWHQQEDSRHIRSHLSPRMDTGLEKETVSWICPSLFPSTEKLFRCQQIGKDRNLLLQITLLWSETVNLWAVAFSGPTKLNCRVRFNNLRAGW